MTAPEFSRLVRADALGATPHAMTLEASPEERAALAKRFGLVAIDRLAAEAVLTRDGDDIRAGGTLTGEVIQSCVASGEPVAAVVSVPFDLLFRPQPAGGRPDVEVELGAAELDMISYDGAAIDIGEAAAETLLLNLDPYPRAAGAAEALKAAGVKSEEEAGPFAALAGLRDKLKE